VLETITEIYIRIWENYLSEIGEFIDVCVLSEGLGTQTGPVISYPLYKEMLEPLLKKHIESLRKKTNANIYLHSCGDVTEFIPSFIDSGVDIQKPCPGFCRENGKHREIKEKIRGSVSRRWLCLRADP